MDIEGLGDKLVDQLVQTGLVRRLRRPVSADGRHSWSSWSGWGRRSAENLLAAIEASKSADWPGCSMACRSGTSAPAWRQCWPKTFGDVEQLRQATVEQLAETPEIGPIIAQSVHAFCSGEFGRQTIDDLLAVGVQMTAPQTARPAAGGKLAGKTFVVTGTLAGYSRDEAHELIVQQGGRPPSSVSKNTDYLVAGEKRRQQARQAQKLGVTVLDEAAFTKLLAE